MTNHFLALGRRFLLCCRWWEISSNSPKCTLPFEDVGIDLLDHTSFFLSRLEGKRKVDAGTPLVDPSAWAVILVVGDWVPSMLQAAHLLINKNKRYISRFVWSS